ncbi:hypothetical protein V6N11_051491 [Hibiscus sabdariffa]|uniref:Reverse transcriptase zinc-binding domain-containing protein n=1 Tax=Hibiscus sabdariffa TaxID=183260 RepID=A0ABR2U787_9ROSI
MMRGRGNSVHCGCFVLLSYSSRCLIFWCEIWLLLEELGDGIASGISFPTQLCSLLLLLSRQISSVSQCKDWEIISQFRGLPRVRIFLWLCYRGSILANGERQRRHLTEDPSCIICGAVNDDVSHVLRECFVARSLESRLVKTERLDDFLRMECRKWLILNLQQPNYFPVHGIDWDVLFGSLLWCLWLKRNTFVFESAELGSDNTFQCGYRLMEESLRARQLVRRGRLAIIS